MGNPSCAPCNPNPCGNIQIVQGSSGSFILKLLALDTDGNPIPFNLTDATEIAVSFPGSDGTPIIEKLSLSEVAIVGAPGAGIIQVNYAAYDSSQMQINPNAQQFQDLQVVVTLSGVAQIDTLTIPAAIVPLGIYSITLNGNLFSYTAASSDTDLSIFTQLLNFIQAYPQSTIPVTPPLPMSGVLSGSAGSASLALTSLYPALGFSDVVSSNITKTPTAANAGTRSVIIYPTILNIQPPSYMGS